MPWGVTEWSEERIDALTTMVLDGVPFSQIAANLNLSRNACIGKARRLKLVSPNRPAYADDPNHVSQKAQAKLKAEENRNARLAKKLALRREKLEKQKKREAEKPKPPVFPFATLLSTEPLNLTMSQLGSAEFPVECRYITNDDMSEPLYCGHATINGSAWCAQHHARVFTTRSQALEDAIAARIKYRAQKKATEAA